MTDILVNIVYFMRYNAVYIYQLNNQCGIIVDGGWSDWYPWGRCSTACGRESRRRYRYCINPRAKHGGKSCDGLLKERTRCKLQARCTGTSLL